MMWAVGDTVMTRAFFQHSRQIRKRVGLPPVKSLYHELFRSKYLTLIAVSKTLCSRQKDWGSDIVICGSFQVPAVAPNEVFDPLLKGFVEDGPAPVFMTFGSAMQFHEDKALSLLTSAIEKAGVRAIIQTPTKRISRDPNIHFVQRISHAQVFPKCSMVVHHGGAGTTQATLRAGKPCVIVAHAYDQPYWARLLNVAGVAPKPLRKANVTSSQLAERIQQVLGDKKMEAKAMEMGKLVRQENGVELAIEAIIDRVDGQIKERR